jgi:RNA polymerase-binding transcription factor DksA
MISRLMDAMFGCWHSHYSFPITIRGGSRRIKAAARTGTYVVCLDCGKELAYDWREMRVVAQQPHEGARALVTKEAA